MKKTYLVAIVIGITVTLWMTSGLLFHSKESNTAGDVGGGNASLTRNDIARVRVQHMQAKPERVVITLRGRTQAKRVVSIKAEVGGRVVSVPIEKGQRVKKGAVLCQLAEDDHVALLEQARAMLEKAKIDYEGALKLREKNLLSVTMVAGSKAALESAKAGVKSAEVAVEHLSMRAPFAGFVEDRPAQIGDLIERSGVCARLVDESVILATGQASEHDVGPLNIGQPVSVQLTSGGEIDGVISFVGRTADAQTRTYRIEATLKANGANVRDGGTVQMAVPLQEVMSYQISPAVLALDDSGQVGVRIVNAEKIVEFHPVQVVRENADGVWVSGLPPEIDLITVGQEFVADGDKVEATPDTQSKENTSKKSNSMVKNAIHIKS